MKEMPIVSCFLCEKVLYFYEPWCFYLLGVYCIDCAPKGSAIFK